MHENEDQVIISDNHVCPHSSKEVTVPQKNHFSKVSLAVVITALLYYAECQNHDIADGGSNAE